VVDAIAHIDIKPPRLTKQGFVPGGAAAMPMAGGVVLGICLRFHNHAPQQLAVGLALEQQAADELGGNLRGGAGEEGLGEVVGGAGWAWWLWEWLEKCTMDCHKFHQHIQSADRIAQPKNHQPS